MRLYDRKWRLTVWRAQPDRFFTPQQNAVVIEDPFRLKFEIEKNTHSEPNKGKITITNLAEVTRRAFTHTPLMARLDAGYVESNGSENIRQVFSGDVTHVYSQRQGPDWETTLQLADGQRAYRYAIISQTFRKGTGASEIVDAIAGAMGLTVSDSISSRLQGITFTKGRTLSGPAHRELSKLIDALPALSPAIVGASKAARARIRWSVQDSQIQVLGDDEVRPGAAWDVNQSTGMVGSPEYGKPTETKKPPTLTVRSLLYPQILPGSSIRLTSLALNGFYRCEKVKHTGDSRGQEWYTEVEGHPQISGGVASDSSRARAGIEAVKTVIQAVPGVLSDYFAAQADQNVAETGKP